MDLAFLGPEFCVLRLRRREGIDRPCILMVVPSGVLHVDDNPELQGFERRAKAAALAASNSAPITFLRPFKNAGGVIHDALKLVRQLLRCFPHLKTCKSVDAASESNKRRRSRNPCNWKMHCLSLRSAELDDILSILAIGGTGRCTVYTCDR